nr:retrovirus-related Pol polyprotein from transposon TNT 1-94 [Tanacetum cinerariifolium]
MFNEYFNPTTIDVSLVPVTAAPRAVDLADSPVSTSIDQDAPLTKLKNFKQAMTEPSWIDAMQEEIHEFERLQDTRRSTSGSAQFLGDKLVSWSSKKHKSTAISSTEAEYIFLSGCCAQIL